MLKSFYRKIGFGIKLDEEIPPDPLKWAQEQLDNVVPFAWEGNIPTEKQMRKKYGEWVYGDRKILRKNASRCILGRTTS
mgnify:CR=1 FL=1